MFVLLRIPLYLKADGLFAYIEQIPDFIRFPKGRGYIDGNDDVGTHLLNDICGQVIRYTAIYQWCSVFFFHGSKEQGHGNGSAQGLGHTSLVKNLGFTGDKISGYCTERNRKLIEIVMRFQHGLGCQLIQDFS